MSFVLEYCRGCSGSELHHDKSCACLPTAGDGAVKEAAASTRRRLLILSVKINRMRINLCSTVILLPLLAAAQLNNGIPESTPEAEGMRPEPYQKAKATLREVVQNGKQCPSESLRVRMYVLIASLGPGGPGRLHPATHKHNLVSISHQCLCLT